MTQLYFTLPQTLLLCERKYIYTYRVTYTSFKITMKGKVCLITGASSGIGAGIAKLFASKGCLLALTGRNETNLKETMDECVKKGAKEEDILLVAADLEKTEDIKRIVEKTIEKFGKLDVLVNNAGMSFIGGLETTLEDYDTILNTNLKAVFYLTQLAMPHLISTKGNVVNVSSLSSMRIYPKFMVYSMGKAALDHFTRTVALEVAKKHVRVNSINPGYVPTNIIKRGGADIEEELLEEYAVKQHALGRAGTVEEMANAVAFLADEQQSSFITGHCMPVDGGSYLKGPIDM